MPNGGINRERDREGMLIKRRDESFPNFPQSGVGWRSLKDF